MVCCGVVWSVKEVSGEWSKLGCLVFLVWKWGVIEKCLIDMIDGLEEGGLIFVLLF